MKMGVITDGVDRDLAHALAVMDEFGLTYAELQFVWDKEVGQPGQGRTPPRVRSVEGPRQEGLQHLPPRLRRHADDHETRRRRCTPAHGHVETLYRGRARTGLPAGPDPVRQEGDDPVGPARGGEVERRQGRLGRAVAADRAGHRSCQVRGRDPGGGDRQRHHGQFLLDRAQADRRPGRQGHAEGPVGSGQQLLAHETAYPDGYETIKDGYLGHMHIKDVYADTPKATLEVRPMGEGQLADQFQPMADALRADGYDGVVSLEAVYHPGDGDFEAGFRQCIGRSRNCSRDPSTRRVYTWAVGGDAVADGRRPAGRARASAHGPRSPPTPPTKRRPQAKRAST